MTIKEWAAVAIASVLGVSASLLMLWPPESGSDVAAWAQALTTALALVVALFLPLHQHERERQFEAMEEAHLRATQLEALYQLAYGVYALCEKVLRDAELERADSRYLRTALGEADAIRSMLHKFEPAHFRGYKELEPAVGIMAAADATSMHLRQAADRADGMQQKGYLKHSLQPMLDSLREKIEILHAIADQAAAEANKH